MQQIIRRLHAGDRPAIVSMLERTANFKPSEVEVALELIDAALNFPAQNDYNIFVLEQEGSVAGYHCTGRRPLTDGVYDMYWIVVDPAAAGGGIGSKLMKHAEDFVKERKGRWLLAETSSKDQYDKTRSFYLKNGYDILCEIPDFYTKGDGLIIFGKHFLNDEG